MGVLFPTYINSYQNLTKLSGEVISESQNIASKVTSKIKGGFISLLNSISNSFTSLKKMFSFSAGNEITNSDKKDSVHLKAEPSIIDENAKVNSADDLSSTSTRKSEFEKLKDEMHFKLNSCFKHQVNS